MTIFDLLFLAAFLASLIALLAAAYAAVRGRTPRAFAILGGWLACAAAYLAISAAVAYLAPQKVMAPGDPWCFDDWCLTVGNAKRADTNYTVSMLISSRAKRVAQRASGAWIYVRDENDAHYDAIPNPAQVPLDVLLQPGESVAATRSFRLPAGVRELGLVTRFNWPKTTWTSHRSLTTSDRMTTSNAWSCGT